MGAGPDQVPRQEAAPDPASLAEILEWRAEHDGERPYLLGLVPEAEEWPVLTYAEARRRAKVLGAALGAAGVQAGDVVGCYFPNSPAWVVATFGVWDAGAVVGAVGTLLSPTEATVLFELAGARVVVAETSSPSLEGDFTHLILDPMGDLVEGWPGDADIGVVADPSLAPAHTDADAVIFFTSGTTGRPKGVPHSHADLVAGARRVANAYARTTSFRPRTAPPDRAPGIIFNPFGHAAGYGRLAFRMWVGRPTVVVPKFSVPAARAILERYPVDSMQLTPAMIHMLATAEEPLSLATVQYVTSGTAPLAPSTRDAFEARYGVPVLQAYGMTEVGAVATETLEDARAGRRGPGSVGRITPGVEVRIVAEDGREVPPGEDGELWVRTARMPTAYVGGAAAPLDEEGWFHTGDIGHLDEHRILFLTSRTQEKLVVGGLNVYPAEVEEALRRSPFVDDAVVVGLPDERLGERPVAGVVWAGQPEPDALTADLRGRLAHYKVPRAYFTLDAVPLTARDKIDRRHALELARRALS